MIYNILYNFQFYSRSLLKWNYNFYSDWYSSHSVLRNLLRNSDVVDRTSLYNEPVSQDCTSGRTGVRKYETGMDLTTRQVSDGLSKIWTWSMCTTDDDRRNSDSLVSVLSPREYPNTYSVSSLGRKVNRPTVLCSRTGVVPDSLSYTYIVRLIPFCLCLCSNRLSSHPV